MSPTVQTAIDEVLQRAVAGGAVPCVAAVAAGRDGVIYEAGPARGCHGAHLPTTRSASTPPSGSCR
jgi:hypothetical protein